MYLKLTILFFAFLLINALNAIAESKTFSVSPLCTMDGEIICPNGFQPNCNDETENKTEPKCLFYENKYVPGCWKFIGIEKIDFSLLPLNMPPSTMIEIIGGGEVYTLNRDIVGCRKL